MTFDEVLEIKNGRNQKAVEDLNGKYPIYGSGGKMGYANSYICNAETVVIGRKGNINTSSAYIFNHIIGDNNVVLLIGSNTSFKNCTGDNIFAFT